MPVQVGKHDEAPTDRNSHLIEPQWGTFGPRLLRREGPTRSLS